MKFNFIYIYMTCPLHMMGRPTDKGSQFNPIIVDRNSAIFLFTSKNRYIYITHYLLQIYL